MTKQDPIYIDLDELDPPEVIFKMGGMEHPMKQVALGDWIANTLETQKLKGADDFASQSEVIIGIILRSFPTLTREHLMEMPLAKLNKILAFANGNNGTNDVNREVQAQANANPLSAPLAPAQIGPSS